MAKKTRQVKNQRRSSLKGNSGSSGKREAPFVSGGEILIMVFYPLLIFLIYAHTLEGPFVFDDILNITENYNIRLSNFTLEGLIKAGSSSRPVATISFALNYYFHQYDVIGYHLINILIHIATGILLYFFLRATLNTPSLRSKHEPHRWIAFFAAFIWLVHPIQIQSVTYIVQRMNSLAAMFFMLSFLLYIRGRKSSISAEKREAQDLRPRTSKLAARSSRSQIPKSYFWYGGSAFAWLLALGCKENAAVLPFFVFLYEWYFFQDLNKDWLKHHLRYIFGAAVIFGLMAFIYLGWDPLGRFAMLTDYANQEFTFSERALTQFRVVIYYLSLLLYPHPSRFNLDYDFALSRSLVEPMTTLLCLLALMGLVGLAVYLAKRERLVSFCILWYLGNLMIESSIIPLAILYEHRTYLPSMLVIALAVALALRYTRSKAGVVAGLCIVGTVCSLWTYERNTVWRDDSTLWRDCVEKSPRKARPRNNLGTVLQERGRVAEAISQYTEALRIKPDFAEAHNNLGNALLSQESIKEAVSHYTEALRIKPEYAKAHYNLGTALLNQGRLAEAVSHYNEALLIEPDNPDVHYNLGLTLAQLGKIKEAIHHYSKTLRFKPGFAQAHYALGDLLYKQGHPREAIRHYHEALRINPGFAEAHNNLANGLLSEGKITEAVYHYLEALRLKPRYVEAHNNLGIILARQGKLEEATHHFSEALRIEPNFAEAHYNLGVALASQGRVDEAIRHYNEALRLKPDHQRAREKLDALLPKVGKSKKTPNNMVGSKL